VSAAPSEAKRLRGGIEVMELESSKATVVAARLTATAKLADE
jgi:hypothetical protein